MIMWPYKFVHAKSLSSKDLVNLDNTIQCLYGPPPEEPAPQLPIVAMIAKFALLVIIPLVACIGAFVWCRKSIRQKKDKIAVVMIAVIIALIGIALGILLFGTWN